MTEQHPIEPQSPYAATKAGADRLCYSYFRTHGLPVVILRPFNAFGPNQYPEKVIPFFYTSAVEGRPLYVYGAGRNTRDWTYVADLCRLIERVLDVPREAVAGQVFNAGSGEERSSLQIAEAVLRYLGRPSSLVRHIKDRPGHVERLVCDAGKAARVLGWQALTRFDAGLRSTLQWYEQNQAWWKRIMRRKAYQVFYRRWYGRTLSTGKAEVRSPKSKVRTGRAT
jgi:dTDP-glucose 4,6-dehydratase